jgi:hypothetical protein
MESSPDLKTAAGIHPRHYIPLTQEFSYLAASGIPRSWISEITVIGSRKARDPRHQASGSYGASVYLPLIIRR